MARGAARRSSLSVPESKPCAVCGRTIEWRKKWKRSWDDVRYCSDACRRIRLTDTDRELETAITEMLAGRAAGATICPSEVAKAVAGSSDEAAWRSLMEPARRAARRLVASGEIEITQKGHVLDPSTAKGPIRLRRTR